jgi:signal transduction histidine kinase
MRPLTLPARIAFIFSVVSTVGILFIGGSVTGLIYIKTEADIEQSLTKKANEIVQEHIAIDSGEIRYKTGTDGQSLSARLRDYDVSLLILDAGNVPVATYGIYRNFSDRNELTSYLNDIIRSVSIQKPSTYLDRTFGSSPLYDTYTRTLQYRGKVVGIMQVAKEATMVGTLADTIRIVLLLVMPLGIVCSILIATAMSRLLLRPLMKFISGVESIDSENLPSELPTYGTSSVEVHILSRVFSAVLGRIRDSMDRQKEFITNASHEIKTPLTRVASNLDVALLDIPKKYTDAHARIREARDEMVQLGDVTDALLSLSMISVKDIPIKSSHSIRVRSFLKNILRKYEPRIEEKKLDVTIDILDSDCIFMDENHATILFANIVSNAVKYNISNGTIFIRGQSDGDTYCLIIENTAGRMSKHDAGHAFDRSYRGINSERIMGTGIGMSIVKDICRFYAFTSSTMIHGTRFVTTIENIPTTHL